LCIVISISGALQVILDRIWFLTAAWIFITVLNQYNQWLFTNSPLLPITEARLTIFTNFPTGTFGSTELLAEYFCLVFIISIIITIYHETFEQLRIKMIYPLIMIFFALMSLIMTASRSAIILAMVAMLYIIINNTMLSSTRQKIRKNSLLVGIVFLIITFLLIFGSYFSLERVIEKLNLIDYSSISLQSIISGDSINALRYMNLVINVFLNSLGG